MDKWCETIVWQSYPECKPEYPLEFDGIKHILIRFDDVVCQASLYWQDKESGRIRDTDFGDFPLENISAFAELPTGSIGEEFGFETADYYMKHGTYCIGVTGIPKKYDGLGGVECVKDYACWHEETLTIDEIQGKWRLA